MAASRGLLRSSRLADTLVGVPWTSSSSAAACFVQKSRPTRALSATPLAAGARQHRSYATGISTASVQNASQGYDDLVLADRPAAKVSIPIDGKTADFSALLLRDSCQCPLCVHSSTRQKLYSTADIPHNIKVRKVEASPTDGSIRIAWQKDAPGFGQEHETHISLDALRDIHNIGTMSGPFQEAAEPAILWGAEDAAVPDIDFEHYMQDDRAVYDMMKLLSSHGLVFVKGIPQGKEDALIDIATRMGPMKDTFYGLTWDVRTVPSAINAAYTSSDLGFHTDLLYFQTPAHIQLLHCLQSSSSGGVSVFTDAFRSAADLFEADEEAFNTLASTPVNYHYNHPDSNLYHTTKAVFELRPLRIGDQVFTTVRSYLEAWRAKQKSGAPLPNITLSDCLEKVNWGPPFLAPFSLHEQSGLPAMPSHPNPLEALNEKVEKWHAAARKFSKLLHRPEALYERLMKPGECVLFNRTRVLHARRAFNADDVGKARWLKGGNCLSRGLKCPGYAQIIRFSSKHERHISHSQGSKASTTKEPAPKLSSGGNVSTGGGLDAAFAVLHSALTDASNNDPAQTHVQAEPEPAFSESTGEQATLYDGLPGVSIYDMNGDFFKFANDIEAEADEELPRVQLPIEYGQPLMDNTSALDVLSYPIRPGDYIPNYTIFSSLVHVPTTLIEYWFSNVCSMWSAFDSELNYNRQVASTTHTTSAAVSLTLQWMSAAHLSSTSPQVKALLPDLTAQAASSIIEAACELRTTETPKVEPGLVFAIFGIGTSSHWTDTAINKTWLDEARALLDTWASSLPPEEAFLPAYFEQALTYWRMLQTTSDGSTTHPRLQRRRMVQRRKLRQAMGPSLDALDELRVSDPPEAFEGTRPNSWCGVSSQVIDAFAQAIVLCRSRLQRRNSSPNLAASCDAISDIVVASELQGELLEMDSHSTILMDELLGFSIRTGDKTTPTSHLIQTAEAYRLAALLQLYMEFEDLDFKFVGIDDRNSKENATVMSHVAANISSMKRNEKITAITLQLVRLLESIPIGSGSRSIHPMLYLSAASGLRFDTNSLAQGVGTADFGDSDVHTSASSAGLFSAMSLFQSVPSDVIMTRSTLEIARARRVILTRLSVFQHSLPSRPLRILADLIRKIWSAYDDSAGSRVHWIEIMDESEAQTMFG
ncbi:Gamma-butyrobetaine dioxygenase [Pseudocercospora fuligena]|uniref:Gamma-butyrobetaine dioxygenase n=1 Tax=Pseudocercospora fuligena TaxID=685502 RepID=A0A8H6VJ50_9PEZI|nr:Gamma-butyrobetaine dioxygenase [Pseudocercospora fuligena]